MDEQLNKLFSSLMSRETLDDLSVEEGIESAAKLIDASGDLDREEMLWSRTQRPSTKFVNILSTAI